MSSKWLSLVMRVCGDFPDLIQSQKSNDTTLHRFPMCDSHYARYIDSILKLLYTRQRQSFRQNAPPINPSQPSYHFEQPVDQVNEAESPTLTESTVANSDTSSHRSSITTISPTSNYSVDLAIHPKVSLSVILALCAYRVNWSVVQQSSWGIYEG